MTPNVRMLMTVLREHADENGVAEMNRPALMAACGFSRTTCQRTEKRAMGAGLLRTTKLVRPHEGLVGSRYILLTPPTTEATWRSA